MNHVSLKRYSKDGLRTLCLCYRVLDIDEFTIWEKKYR